MTVMYATRPSLCKNCGLTIQTGECITVVERTGAWVHCTGECSPRLSGLVSRDNLARSVARLWREGDNEPRPGGKYLAYEYIHGYFTELEDALERLAEAYGLEGVGEAEA